MRFLKICLVNFIQSMEETQHDVAILHRSDVWTLYVRPELFEYVFQVRFD